MDIAQCLYPSGLIPAASGVNHGYKNFWVRDGYYVGICSPPALKGKIWQGMIDLLDRYRWKLEYHAKHPPLHWYEYLHVRYSPEGKEIGDEHWLHNQWDCIGNLGEVCLDVGRLDLADLLVRYLSSVRYHRHPSAGAWEDRNTCDAYSLASCIHFLQRAKHLLPGSFNLIEQMVYCGVKRLYRLLPFATPSKTTCLSLLGVVWPFDMAGPFRHELIDRVKRELMREPFGFIRYPGDSYDGSGFTRGIGTEMPWLLGDAFMCFVEPENELWRNRLEKAVEWFGCVPEAYCPTTMIANRNTPLIWPEAMLDAARRGENLHRMW